MRKKEQQPISAVRKVVDFFTAAGVRLAARLGATFDLDLVFILAAAEKTEDELVRAEKEDGTPDLLRCPYGENVTWREVILALAAETRSAMAQPGARIEPPVVPSADRLTPAVEEAEEVRRLVAQAIGGNGSDPENAERLRRHVFAGRPQPTNKAMWETEMRLEYECILTVADPPPGLLKLAPRILAAAEAVSSATVLSPGRPTRTAWSPAVVERALALNHALGELLSWSSSTATRKRNAALLKAITPKRTTDNRRQESAEPGPVVLPSESAA